MLVQACGPSAAAQTIRLKNGRTISADQVRDAGDIIEYEQGENSFAIPKSVVDRIEAAAPVGPRAAADFNASLSVAEVMRNDSSTLFVETESSALPPARTQLSTGGRFPRIGSTTNCWFTAASLH